MAAAGWAPDIIASGNFTVGVDQMALENQGLLDTDVLVVGQTCTRAIRIKAVSRPVASSTSKVLASHARKLGRLPGQRLDIDKTRAERLEIIVVGGVWRNCRHAGSPGYGCLPSVLSWEQARVEQGRGK